MSSWVSCQKIVFNLHKAYQLNENLELLNFNYSTHQTPDDIVKTAQDIVEAQPDVILILDHKPHPLPLFQVLIPYLNARKLQPRFIFHVFGDFTLYYAHWGKLGKLIEGHKVEFVVASERQKHLIDKFLPSSQGAVICPFPVDRNEFSFNPAIRKLQRLEWGVDEDEMVFIYTGRLSRQKRIHTLLQSFSDFLKISKTQKARLYLYGNPDSIGDMFLGKWEIEGEYFRKFNRIYRSLDPDVQEKIHFMGSVPNLELRSVYQGADVLVNLSVHNDEDFGMSVAEAQCCGLPSTLTDWGGLYSFRLPEVKGATSFIPVKIGKRSKLIHFQSIVDSFIEAHKQGPASNREEISRIALEKLSVEAASGIVKAMMQSPAQTFTEFTPFFEKVLERFSETGTPYISDLRTVSNLYREIYSSYVRDH